MILYFITQKIIAIFVKKLKQNITKVDINEIMDNKEKNKKSNKIIEHINTKRDLNEYLEKYLKKSENIIFSITK